MKKKKTVFKILITFRHIVFLISFYYDICTHVSICIHFHIHVCIHICVYNERVKVRLAPSQRIVLLPALIAI